MTGYVMAATDAGGERFGERVVPTAPTLGEAAAFGDSYRMNYVSVRRGHDDITLYGRDATGTWSVLVADAPPSSSYKRVAGTTSCADRSRSGTPALRSASSTPPPLTATTC
ncbi:hypothetical protein GCM10017744_020300 [Streptomyces antimycoticus]|uniref:Uncharacterized protein n=1 Tax=Streptomyces antimycoticus TaxID=68175 RepID=A0A4D4KLF5_9ACTN|nr:hypothetical protein [Streptomyces antimycoticus]GDY47278.1 hypothetical protein SANT12839_081600 [Streptomyces antimycoticus]